MELYVSSSKKIKELIAALEPYAPVWQEWIESGGCFLSKKEIKLIKNYLTSGSHFKSASELNVSTITAASMLQKVQFRLFCNYSLFQNWLTEHLLENHGIVTYSSLQDRFLNSPLLFLPISHKLKFKLKSLSEYTLSDILAKYTENQLKTLCCLNPTLICELKHILIQNECLHLLK